MTRADAVNPEDPPDVDELIDRAIEAIGKGDRETADALACQVLAAEGSNTDAEDLLAPPVDHGEIRRLTIMFADLVDSTALSTQVDPETYRTVIGRTRSVCAGPSMHTKGTSRRSRVTTCCRSSATPSRTRTTRIAPSARGSRSARTSRS